MISLFLYNLQIYFIQKHMQKNYAFIFSAKPRHLIAFSYMISTKDLSIFSNNLRERNERSVWSTHTHFLEASSSTGRSFFFMRLFRLQPQRIFNLKTKNLAQEGFFVKLDYIMVPQTKVSPHFKACSRAYLNLKKVQRNTTI